MVILVMGLPGSGKSIFASKLAEFLHADYINSDRLRMNQLSNRTYSEEEKERIYDDMLIRMEDSVNRYRHVVLDATFNLNRIREKFIKKASKTEALAIIEINAAEAVIKKRISHKREFSEANFDIYQKIKRAWEPIPQRHLTLESTNHNLHFMLQKAIGYLYLIKNEKGRN